MNKNFFWTGVALLAAATSVTCGSSEDAGSSTGGSAQGGAAGTNAGGSNVGGSSAGGTGGTSGSCDPDPLRTNLGDPVNVDTYDCLILQFAQKYSEPDAMIFKAMIRIESHFKNDAMGCTAPCGTPAGWTTDEVKCLGLMQIVVACSPDPGDLGLGADGHPNMTTDPASPLWAGSIFNPVVNIERGISVVANNRKNFKEKYAGCTEEQYTLMSVGSYASYGSTHSCTSYNTEYTDLVVKFYKQYAEASGWTPRPY